MRLTFFAGTLLALPALVAHTADTPATETETNEAVTIALEGDYQEGRFPLLKIHCQRGGTTETVMVRFPEIIEAWDASTEQQLKFYQDNRSPAWPVKLACEPVETPAWEGGVQKLHYTMRFDNKMVLHSSAEVQGRRVVLRHQLDNATSHDLHRLAIWNCVQGQLAPSLADPLAERTAVPLGKSFTPFRECVEGLTAYPKEEAERHRFCAYSEEAARWHGESPHVIAHPGFPDDPNQTISFWHVQPLIRRAVIATQAVSGDWGIATSSEIGNGVWTNPAITCHHADAFVMHCPPGDKGETRTNVHFYEGKWPAE